jgi:hypothetical protein
MLYLISEFVVDTIIGWQLSSIFLASQYPAPLPVAARVVIEVVEVNAMCLLAIVLKG